MRDHRRSLRRASRSAIIRPTRSVEDREYLQRYHDVQISNSGVWRILKRLGMERLPASQRYKRHHRRWKRYEQQRPGHHVQIDVKFIEPITCGPHRRKR